MSARVTEISSNYFQPTEDPSKYTSLPPRVLLTASALTQQHASMQSKSLENVYIYHMIRTALLARS